MKKRIFRIVAVVLLACFGMTMVMAGCTDTGNGNDTTYTVTYAGGDGATGTAPTEVAHKEGERFILKDNTFKKKGFAFTKWNDGTKDYTAGSTYTMPAKNVVLTAQWTAAEQVTLTYALGDYTTGTAPAAETVDKGDTVKLAAAPVWEGYDFLGWRVGEDLKQVGDEVVVSANITVTAEWEKHTPPMDGTWTATAVSGSVFGFQGNVELEASVKKSGMDVYTALRITSGEHVLTLGVIFESATEGWKADPYTLTIDEEGTKLTVGGLGEDHDKTVDLTGRTEFSDTLELTGAYSATAGEKTYFVDFDYNAIDLGDGYYIDAEVVSMGKYVVAYFEQEISEETTEGAIVFEKEGESVVTYSEESKLTFATATARAKSASFAKITIVAGEGDDEGKVFLVVEGTYAGYTPGDLTHLLKDHADDQQKDTGFNISFYCAKDRTAETKFTLVDCEVKAGKAKVTLDITELPENHDYGVLANNSGYGDIAWGSNTVQSVTVGERNYQLESYNPGSGNVTRLAVTPKLLGDWSDVTTTITDIRIAANEAEDSVLVTMTGTYKGCSKEDFETRLSSEYHYLPIVYFYGSKPGAGITKTPDLDITVEDATWTIVLDVTTFEDDYTYAICTQRSGFNSRSSGTEFRFEGIEDTTVELGERLFTLAAQGGDYNHNALVIGKTNAAATLTYSLGDWKEGEAPAAFKAAKGSKIALVEAPERDGFNFLGWKVGEDLKQPGDRIQLNADTTVTAQWEAKPVTMEDYTGYWTGGKVDMGSGEVDVEFTVSASDQGANIVMRVFSGEEVLQSLGIRFETADEGYALGDATLKLIDGKLVFSGTMFGDDPVTFETKTPFGEDDPIDVTGTYSSQAEMYIDIEYGAIDMGEGYLEDADFVPVGKYLVPFMESEGQTMGTLVLEKGENDTLVSHGPEGMEITFTACEKRAQTALRLAKITLSVEGEKIYLTAKSNVLNNFTARHLMQLWESHDDDELDPAWAGNPDHEASVGIGFNPSIYGTGAVANKNWTVTVSVSEGVITAKFDVTDLPTGSYIILANNSGHGDTKFSANGNVAEIKECGEKKYSTLSGAYDNATLSIVPVSNDTLLATKIVLALDNEDESSATKVLVTISGNYGGDNYTKDVVKGMLEQKYADLPVIFFWGPKANTQSGKDYVVTVNDDGTFSITFDVTELKDDPDGSAFCTQMPNGLLDGRNPDTEFRCQDVTDTSVHFNGRTYSLKKVGVSDHNSLYITPDAAE